MTFLALVGCDATIATTSPAVIPKRFHEVFMVASPSNWMSCRQGTAILTSRRRTIGRFGRSVEQGQQVLPRERRASERRREGFDPSTDRRRWRIMPESFGHTLTTANDEEAR